MTLKRVRVRVRCESCRAAAILSPEQYRTLVKESQVMLHCPHCTHGFLYNPIGIEVAAPAPPEPAEVDFAIDLEPLSPAPAEEPALVSAPDFPPPPFAPLGMGAASPVKAPDPAFALLDGAPAAAAAPPRHRAKARAGSEGKSLTLNDRWKSLPPWVQWLVVGLTVVLLAAVIFAVPVGGSGNGKPEAGAVENRPAKSEPDRSAHDKPASEGRQP